MEIERKFLLASFPHRRTLGKGAFISQAYISVGDPEIRVRSKAKVFYLTIKKGSGLARDQFEARIPPVVFKKLRSMTVGKEIRKTRYTIPDGGLRWQIDKYHGHLKGLYTAEVELANPTREVRIPGFLAVVADVTSDDRYKNKNLAAKGAPKFRRRIAR